jgi:hypothetical protein
MEPERQAAPEPVVAPQAAPGAAGPIAAGPVSSGFGPVGAGFGNTPVRAASAAHVLALQRAAGNQAVSNLLQRDGEKTAVSGPGDFGVEGGEPKSSGNTAVTPGKPEYARIQSPDVAFSGKVWLQDDKKLDGTAYVGYVQNLVHSDRGAVYRRGGDPAGEIVGEDHTGVSNRWDAVNDPKAEDEQNKMIPAAGVFPPFYWKPSSIGDGNDKANPVTTDPATHDRPEFSMPVKKGPGRITQFTGKDEFKLGLAVKKDETVHMLRSYDWEIGWDANVDANLNGAGAAVQSVESVDPPDVSLTEWSLDPKKPGDPFEAFATQERAMQKSPAELMGWLLAAQKHDHVTYRNICAALDAKDPSVTIAFSCETTNDLIGRDHVHIHAEAGGGAHSGQSVQLKKGESASLSMSIKELFGSAGAIAAGSMISVSVSHQDGPEGQAVIGVPFSGSKTMAVGSGSYTATASLG